MDMSKVPRRTVWLVAGASVLLGAYAFWPKPIQHAILYAYSDNAFSMWGLTLYKDGRFFATLPTSHEKGRFRVIADTIELQYETPSTELPAAYFINRERRQIEELQRISGRWVVVHRGNWAELYYDSTQYYTR